MSLFKRISSTLVSRIDQVVGEIENHDAVIQVALDDMRKKIAEARVRQNQVQREAVRLKQQIEEQRAQAERWRERAVECASRDEQKAMECVRRAKQCDQQVARITEAQANYEVTTDKLARDLAASEQRLQDMKQKQTLMRARQSTGNAINATSETENAALLQMDESFDRWEMKLNQLEMSIEPYESIDPLSHEFETQEQDAALKAELEALLNREDKS